MLTRERGSGETLTTPTGRSLPLPVLLGVVLLGVGSADPTLLGVLSGPGNLLEHMHAHQTGVGAQNIP